MGFYPFRGPDASFTLTTILSWSSKSAGRSPPRKGKRWGDSAGSHGATATEVYGLLSFVVGQRTTEIGVRMALGASRLQILCDVLVQGVRLAGAGILIGLFASLALARLMSTLLFGVHPNDPFVLGAITCILRAGIRAR